MSPYLLTALILTAALLIGATALVTGWGKR